VLHQERSQVIQGHTGNIVCGQLRQQRFSSFTKAAAEGLFLRKRVEFKENRI